PRWLLGPRTTAVGWTATAVGLIDQQQCRAVGTCWTPRQLLGVIDQQRCRAVGQHDRCWANNTAALLGTCWATPRLLLGAVGQHRCRAVGDVLGTTPVTASRERLLLGVWCEHGQSGAGPPAP